MEDNSIEKAISLDEIKKLRNQLPDDWKWTKCYELSYISSGTGREFIKKHWALTAPDGKGLVCSLGLISHDAHSNKKEFFENDIPVEWVQKSLKIVDSLLSLLNRGKNDKPSVATGDHSSKDDGNIITHDPI